MYRFRSLSSVSTTPRHAAFTLIEVMIAVAVLTIGMFGVLSMIPTLASARTLAVEMVIARQIASSVAERIQGAAWSELGGTTVTAGSYNTEAWSLPRYREVVSGTNPNPPMSEGNVDPNHNLLANGLIAQRTGVPDLKVYLEYYTGLIMNDRIIANRATDRASFMNAISLVGNRMNMKESNATGNNANASVIVRIVVTWREQNGAPVNSHEIFTSRKQ